MRLPAEVVVALVGLGSTALGVVLGHILTRRSRSAQVELTEAQTADIETQVYERVIKRYEAEQKHLIARVQELEAEVRILRGQLTRNAEREQELLAELNTVRAERDQLRIQLAAAQAAAAAHKEHAQSHLGGGTAQAPTS